MRVPWYKDRSMQAAFVTVALTTLLNLITLFFTGDS